MKIKRLLALLLAFVFVIPITACKSGKNVKGSSSTEYEWVYEDVTVSGEPGTQKSESGGSSKKPSSNNSSGKKVTTVEGNNYTVRQSQKPMDEGLDFGGKTFLYAGSGTSDPKTLRVIKAFEKKYNCKFTIVNISRTGYIAKVAAQMSTGRSYDVGQFLGGDFPSAVIANIWEPLDDYFTSADEYDSAHPEKGGIRIDKSIQGFLWKDKIYAVCGQKYAGVKVLAYNKLRFENEGLPDPMEMYNAGTWTWDSMIELGEKVYRKGEYYLGGVEFRSNWEMANGAHWVVRDGDTFKENCTDKKLFNALQWTQDLVFGEDSIINPHNTSDAEIRMENFVTGANYMCMVSDYNYRHSLGPKVMDSPNFGATPEERRSNLAMVPMPLGPDNNEKLYPCEWFDGVCAGKGSDPRVAVAWAKFRWAYADPVKDEYTLRANEENLINKLLDGPTNVNNYNFQSSSESLSAIMSAVIVSTTTKGGDVAETLDGVRSKMQAVIDSVMSEQ